MHFKFIDNTSSLGTPIHGSYDLVLVMLSITIACIASYNAFILTRRIHRENKTSWLLTGSIIQGTGIWAMHFIGMLAFKLPDDITVSYDPVITVISILPAIIASFIVFKTHPDQSNIFLNSIFMGLGIATMHYTGMSGMTMNAMMLYDSAIFTSSIFLAIALSNIALRLKIWATQSTEKLILFDKNFIIAAIVMGIAISAMHYTAMLATFYFPSNTQIVVIAAISHQTLAWIIGITTTAIIVSLIIAIKISDRNEVLQIIRENDARINSIINNTSDGIISINQSGLIEIFNHGAEIMFAYDPTEVIGKDVSVLMCPEEQESHKHHVRHSAMHEPRILNRQRDLMGKRKDGSLFPIEINISPITYMGKHGYVGMIRDITERKKNEADLIQARELAEASSKAKMKFISLMSHELRTPLNSILGFTQLMQLEKSGPVSDEQKHQLDHIENAGKNLLSIINNIIDLSSVESSRVDINLDAVHITSLIEECINTIKPDLTQRHLELNLDINHCKDIFVHADYIRLKQVLLNLLSNACKYNTVYGKVKIHCETSNNIMLKISISDTGPGIPDNQINNLFEPFNRLGKENSEVTGSGIGLNISLKLLELMNGYIGIENNIDQGSTFWIEIPIYKKQ